MNLGQIVMGLVLSTMIGGLAYWRGSLSPSGWCGAVVVGTLTFGFGGWPWGLMLIAFFISSSVLSHYKERIKEARAAEKFAKGGRRDFAQTMANGGIGALLALAYGVLGEPPILLGLFAGVMGTVTADTWATELGVLSRSAPRLITNLRPVEPGTSGGISAFGSVASLLGGLFVGGVLWIVALVVGTPYSPVIIAATAVGGLVGSFTDSLLGATVQTIYAYPDGRETERTHDKQGRPNRRVRGLTWMNNDLVNLLSSLVGGVVCAALWLLLA